jgi:hypothetical protein
MMEVVAAVVCAFLAICCWPGRDWQRRQWVRLARTSDAPEGNGADAEGSRSPATSGWRSTARDLPGRAASPVRPTDVATAMELLALVTASGGGVGEALDRVAAVSPERVRADLATVVAAQAWGVDIQQAWSLVPGVWKPADASLTLAATAGVPPSGILVRAAADCRAAHAQVLDLAAARLGVRLVLPLGLAFLPAFVLLTVVPLVVALAGQVLL